MATPKHDPTEGAKEPLDNDEGAASPPPPPAPPAPSAQAAPARAAGRFTAATPASAPAAPPAPALAAREAAPSGPPKRYEVQEDKTVSVDGHMTVMRKGKILTEGSYGGPKGIARLRQTGLKIKEFTGATPDEM